MASESRILTADNVEEIAQWCGGRAVVQHDALDEASVKHAVNVPVGDEAERAQIGDMVIRQHDGSFRIHKREWYP